MLKQVHPPIVGRAAIGEKMPPTIHGWGDRDFAGRYRSRGGAGIRLGQRFAETRKRVEFLADRGTGAALVCEVDSLPRSLAARAVTVSIPTIGGA
jgi:hypothetical protein